MAALMTAASSAAPTKPGVQTHGLLTLGVAAFALLAATTGCQPSETVELVALRGCGVDQEFSGLRVRVVGDFSSSTKTELLLGPGERGQISTAELDVDRATGVVVEGLFGTTVTAVGRSHGIDPDLARGRVAGVDGDAGVLPIYFAAPDSACEVASDLSPRAGVAIAAGPSGDLLLAGGRAPTLLDELVHVDLFGDRVRTLADRLPSPRWGASVHALTGRRFVVLGGATVGSVLAERVVVEVAGAGSVLAVEPLELAGDPPGLAHHAAALGPDGAVWLVGGCDEVDDAGACVPASAHARSYRLELEPHASELLAALERPRYAADLRVSPDGIAYVAGGIGVDGVGLPSLERLSSGGTWELVHSLPDERAIAGLAVLDGGLVVLSDHEGGVHWWSEAGSGTLDPTSRAPALDPFVGPRPLLTLPGERVFVDGWLFAPGTAAVDPALERHATAAIGRSGAALVPLADASALIVGGWEGASSLASPALLRLRPRLDGPDEWLPDLAGPATEAFVCNAPGHATVIVGGLQVEGQGPAEAIAPVHAHVRGFRSGALRLEFEYEADPGVRAQLVVGQGARAAVHVSLSPTAIVVRRREPSGAVEQLDCSVTGEGVAANTAIVVELDDQARSLALGVEGGPQLRCDLDWPSDAGVSVGFGASGPGSARFFRLRLARG
jgi:hypothetical protein